MKIYTKILEVATETAKKSDVSRGKVGAICFTNKGCLITSAYNKILLGHKKKFTVHAEMALLAKLVKLRARSRFGIKNLNILVVRYKAETNSLAIAKPCQNCQYYLNIAGITVYYSNRHGKIIRLEKTDGI